MYVDPIFCVALHGCVAILTVDINHAKLYLSFTCIITCSHKYTVYSQLYGKDYDKIFSIAVRFEPLRIPVI